MMRSTLVKQRPITFVNENSRATKEGRKTITRRIINPQPILSTLANKGLIKLYRWHGKKGTIENCTEGLFKQKVIDYCPYGHIGDILWVKEKYAKIHFKCGGAVQYLYVFPDTVVYPESKEAWKWKSSRFMPKEAARLWLQITDIRVEQLQDITEFEALEEGIEILNSSGQYKSYVDHPEYGTVGCYTAKDSFQTLWESINGAASWESNPWVWVICYKVIPKPEGGDHA